MWIIPSRGRPQILARFFERFVATGATTPGRVRLDDDDPCLGDYEKLSLPVGWAFKVGPRIGCSPAQNELFYDHRICGWYGMLGDDAVPVTYQWDRKLIDAAGSRGIAYCDDGMSITPVAGHAVIGGDLARELGWVMLPGLKRICGDNVLIDIGQKRKCLTYLPDVRVEHWHFSNGKAPFDATYEKSAHVALDRTIYKEWRAAYLGIPELLGPSVTVCCVNAGNYCGRGAEYVNHLYDMVTRNLPAGFPGKFVCFTDDKTGLTEGIEARPLPVRGLEGWWNKLALFKDGVFPDGARVWFFDLDTLITGPLEDLFKYDGDFATLTDFYHPHLVGPAVMAWKVGENSKSIFNEWSARKFAQDGHGDLWWLNDLDQGRFAKRCDKLDKLFPAKFVSYKVHCRPYSPKGSSVVCFHGEPKPHNCGQEWVKGVWKIGGWTQSTVETYCNTADEKLSANIRQACTLPIHWLTEAKAHDDHAVIVGGGPSLQRDGEWLKRRSAQGQTFFALNNAASFLTQNGISPEWQIVMDARPSNAAFVSRDSAKRHLLASQCDPSVFAKVDLRSTVLWHAEIPRILDDIPEQRRKDAITIGGGTTVLTRAMVLAYAMGYRTLHLYGVDSSYEDDAHHAYPQTIADSDKPSEVMAGERIFRAAPWMIAQVYEFQDVATELANLGCEISVHGDGLLPTVAHAMARAANLAA